MQLTREAVTRAALGGAFLGCGGGGSMRSGILDGEMALEVGDPRLVSLSELKPDDLIVTVSAVGAPAAKEQYTKPADFVSVLRVLNERLGGRIAGIISSENGGHATLNGWFQSAMTGIPMVDAACNGRAHPTGTMGSMGLDLDPSYRSIMAAAGGNPAAGRRVEIVVEGTIGVCDRLVRQACVEAGGGIAVARNPVTAAYVQANGAPGAVSLALELGGLIQEHQAAGGMAVAKALVDRLDGQILAEGEVTGYALETKGGFDVGRLAVDGVAMTFWNEYMTADRDGQRLFTFPDLIATISAETGAPVTTAEIRNGQRVIVVGAPKSQMILGTGVRRAEAMRPVESILNEELVRYF